MAEEIVPDTNSFEFTVDGEDNATRVDIYLTEHIPEASRSQVQRLIREGQLLVNNRVVNKANHRLEQGDAIAFTFLEPPARGLRSIEMDLDIIFEDDDLIIINKPAGIMVHPGAGRDEPTLVEGVLFHLRDNFQFSHNELESGRPGVVHRLDADTSGVMVFAKNSFSHAKLSDQFQSKTNLRIYKALLCGEIRERDKTFKSYLYRDPKHRTSFASISLEAYQELCEQKRRTSLPGYKYAESFFKVEKVFSNAATLVSVKLSTGRTHQIRVHAKAEHRPVAGDPVYGGDFSMVTDPKVSVVLQKLKRQMLHAQTLGITHPRSNEKLAFQADPPDDFSELIEFLESIS